MVCLNYKLHIMGLSCQMRTTTRELGKSSTKINPMRVDILTKYAFILYLHLDWL